MLTSVVDTGSRIQVTHSVNSGVYTTLTSFQSSDPQKITLTSNGGGAAFVGGLTPAWQGALSVGMVLKFKPTANCSGTPTLALDGGSAVSLKEADGTTAMSCNSGVQFPIWYDGQYWRKESLTGTINLDTASGDINASQIETGAVTGVKLASNLRIMPVGVSFDGGGSVIPAGSKSEYVIPYDCTLLSWNLVADQTGSIVIDIWKATTYPTVSNTITASAKPTLSGAQLAKAQAVTGWTTSVTAGDVLVFNVDSATTITRATLTMSCQR